MNRAPGTLRLVRLLARTALLRIVRSTAIARIRRGGRERKGKRGRPPRSGLPMLLLILLTIPLFAFQATLMSGMEMRRLANGATGAETAAGPSSRVLREYELRRSGRILFAPEDWPSKAHEQEFLVAVGGLTTLLVLLAFAASMGLANEDLGRPEWSFLFLFGFPVATGSLVLARILATSLVQVFCWIAFLPVFAQLLHGAGAGWASLPLGALGAYSTSLMIAAARVWLETVIRLRFPIQRVRTIQAMFSLVALCGFGVIILLSRGGGNPTMDIVGALGIPPSAILALPWNWPLTVTRSGVVTLVQGILLTLAVVVLCHRFATRRLGRGIVATTGTSTVRSRAGAVWARSSRLSGVLGKEVRLLLRDRNFLAQTLLAPAFFVVIQFVAQPSLSRMKPSTTTDLAAIFAFGIGAYALSAGCFQVLAGERRALWMLYASPIRIDVALREKSRLWIRIGGAFALATLIAIAAQGNSAIDPLRFASDAVFALAGVFCAGRIATAIGILGTDLRTEGSTRRVKARFYYLHLFLAGIYTTGLATDDIAVRGAVLLGMGTLTAALWDRVRTHLPSLLDPSPPRTATITLLDGIAAVITLALVQALGFLALVVVLGRPFSSLGPGLTYGVGAIAGIVTVMAFGLLLSTRGVHLFDALRPRKPWRRSTGALALGAAVGAALGALGLGYLALGRSRGWFDSEVPTAGSAGFVALAIAGVVVAPFVEEMLFRAILFRAMRQLVRVPIAVAWSAALFAVCHPQPAWAPVFVVGVATALLFQRTGWLPASMATHAVYNLIVLTWT